MIWNNGDSTADDQPHLHCPYSCQMLGRVRCFTGYNKALCESCKNYRIN